MRGRSELTRGDILAGAGTAPSGLLAGPNRVAGQEVEPLVWLDMTQAELDDAHNHRVYAPNMNLVLEQRAFRNELAKARLGPPLEVR